MNISVDKSVLPYVCTYCQMGKNHKLAFPNSQSVYNKPLELVTTDLWGPAPVNSDYGFNYYLSLGYSYSRHVWIYFLKSISETCAAITQFIIQAEKQTEQHVKKIQTNGGVEFKPLKEFFNKHGILHRITCPHTSEHNGLVERKHRQIVETGLTLLAQAGLPLKFWPDVFSTSVYLINR